MLKRITKYCFIWIVLLLIFIFWLNFYIYIYTKKYIFQDIKNLPSWAETVMILGAKVYKNWYLSDIIRDRTDTAISVLQNKKSDTVLVSADNSKKDYDEVRPTRDYLIKTWIKSENIFLDFAGFDTYDSMFRAKNIFWVKKMIISTQAFHLPRAVWIARNMGIEAYGIAADQRHYKYAKTYKIREILANIKAFGEVILQNNPHFTWQKIPINWKSNAF